MGERVSVLDNGYVELVEHWGSDESIICAARMSTNKGFEGWGPYCAKCGSTKRVKIDTAVVDASPGKTFIAGERCADCKEIEIKNGDEKLLGYLYNNRHMTPFEMGGCIVEVQAPIFVFREWHRHRTQCLAPDTLVHFEAPKSKGNRRFVYKMRIEDIWKKWQPTTRTSRPERQVNPYFPRSRIQAMQLRCLDEERREFVHTSIVDVIRGEPKPMWRVTTTSGRQLTATREHKVFTQVGWVALGKAIDSKYHLAAEGTTRGKLMSWETPSFDESKEEWKPVWHWEETYEVSNMGRVRRRGCEPRKATQGTNGYFVVSLNRPGVQETRTVHSLVLEAFKGFLVHGESPVWEARHLNHNRADNRLENLEWGTAKQNSEDRVRDDRNQRLVAVYEEIIEVEYVGELPTYDLSVADPWHNFVADGFVVHNSYNEMSARYTPLPDVNYMPTIDRLMVNANASNKQANRIAGAAVLTEAMAKHSQALIREHYEAAESRYQSMLQLGVPKELARVVMPVGRYSRMRASANLRNWLAFLTLRDDVNAQFEIQQYAKVVDRFILKLFPRTHALYVGSRK